MKSPEKFTERFHRTIIRTIFTTTVIVCVTTVSVAIHQKPTLHLIGTIWLMVFSIVFGGHWPELLYTNYIRFRLPSSNVFMLYLARMVYWYLSSIPLIFLAYWVGNSLNNGILGVPNWQLFGLIYIGIQLFMQFTMHLRQKKSLYNGTY